MRETITKQLPTDDTVPERMRGRQVEVILNEETKKLTFSCDMPDDPTPNEIGFIKWFIGEYTDSLRKEFPFIGHTQNSRLEDTPISLKKEGGE